MRLDIRKLLIHKLNPSAVTENTNSGETAFFGIIQAN